MTRPGTLAVSRSEHDALTYLLAYEVHEGVLPTRAACDRAGYGDVLCALARRGLVREPASALDRVRVTGAGRAVAVSAP